MAEPNGTVETSMGDQGRVVPGLDGTTGPAAKPKKKQPKRSKCNICQHPTQRANRICRQCTSDQNKARSSKSSTGPTDAQNGTNTRESSTIATPEPVVDGAQMTNGTTGRSPSYVRQSSLIRNRGRHSIYSPQSSADQNESPENHSTAPQEVKSEVPELQTSASPLPLVNWKAVVEPVMEGPISSSNKRPFFDVERGTPDNDGEVNLDTAAATRKQRKLTSPVIHADDNAVTEEFAIDAFQAAVTAQEATQVQQLNDLQRAQEEQLEALRSAHDAQHDALSTANARFIASFKTLQSSRDYFEGEMEDWKAKHISLEAKLEATEDDRDNWKAAKQQVDREKEGVEKERDDWKSAKEKLDEEKATVEQAWARSDETNAQQIDRLKKQVEKLRKGKADLIKQLTAGDSE